jgi:hypothetical protein
MEVTKAGMPGDPGAGRPTPPGGHDDLAHGWMIMKTMNSSTDHKCRPLKKCPGRVVVPPVDPAEGR